MRRSRRRRVGLALASVALTLCLAELALRLVFPAGFEARMESELWTWMVRDPVLGWRNRSGHRDEQITINDLAFRGPPAARRKPEGTLRIVCLGDSRTFGTWLDLGRFRYDNDYPRRLAQLLRSDPATASAEVINAGVIGHTSSHGLRWLRTGLRRLDADILIVAYGINEQALAWNAALRAQEPRSAPLRLALTSSWRLRLTQVALFAYQNIPLLHPAPLSVRWATREQYALNLRRIAEVARGRRWRLLLLALPLRPAGLGENRPAFPGADGTPYALLGARDLHDLHATHARYQEVLAQVAAEQEIPVLDAETILTRPGAPPAFGAYDLIHPNEQGAGLVAAALHSRLRELGWLDAGTR